MASQIGDTEVREGLIKYRAQSGIGKQRPKNKYTSSSKCGAAKLDWPSLYIPPKRLAHRNAPHTKPYLIYFSTAPTGQMHNTWPEWQGDWQTGDIPKILNNPNLVWPNLQPTSIARIGILGAGNTSPLQPFPWMACSMEFWDWLEPLETEQLDWMDGGRILVDSPERIGHTQYDSPIHLHSLWDDWQVHPYTNVNR